MPDGSKHDIGDRHVRGLLGGEGGEEGEGGPIVGAAADYVTPQMYGAVGDGETDDYEAFVKMFATGPAYVYIPAGRYYISAPLTIANGIHAIKGAGVGVTGIICDNGFIDSGSSVVYRLHVSDIGLTCRTKDNTGIAINGKYSYCTFSRILADYFEKAFSSSGNSWINVFDRCEFNNNSYAVYCSADSFNNITFRGCSMQYNGYAFFNEKTGSNVVFSECDIERNSVGFHTKDQRVFVVRDSYLENNEKLFEILSACYGADWTLENNFIYSNSDASGWLIDLPTSDINTVPFAVFNIDKCYIRHESADYEPFAFHDGYEYSHVAVNIHECRFYHRPDTYLSLFDFTNCTYYGSAWNRLPIDTDLIYHKEGDLRWYCHCGNSYDDKRSNSFFEVIGTYPGYSATSDKFAINMSNSVGRVEGEGILGGAIFVDNQEATPYIAFLSEIKPGGLVFTASGSHTLTPNAVAHVHIKY